MYLYVCLALWELQTHFFNYRTCLRALFSEVRQCIPEALACVDRFSFLVSVKQMKMEQLLALFIYLFTIFMFYLQRLILQRHCMLFAHVTFSLCKIKDIVNISKNHSFPWFPFL